VKKISAKPVVCAPNSRTTRPRPGPDRHVTCLCCTYADCKYETRDRGQRGAVAITCDHMVPNSSSIYEPGQRTTELRRTHMAVDSSTLATWYYMNFRICSQKIYDEATSGC
jgi:hypothetical protein